MPSKSKTLHNSGKQQNNTAVTSEFEEEGSIKDDDPEGIAMEGASGGGAAPAPAIERSMGQQEGQ